MITYSVHHPAMSEPLIMESETERQPRALAARASLYIMQQFDECLPVDEFTVTQIASGY